jgi:hypothetical protein
MLKIGSQHGRPMVEEGSKEERSLFLPQQMIFFILHFTLMIAETRASNSNPKF